MPDSEQKINQINDEENLHRNLGLEEKYYKDIKSMNLMELIANEIERVSSTSNSDSRQKDIANFGIIIPPLDPQQSPVQRTDETILLIDLLSNENVSIEQLIKNEANKELYTNNIDGLLQNLNINNKKLFYVPKKSGEVNSELSKSFTELLTSA